MRKETRRQKVRSLKKSARKVNAVNNGYNVPRGGTRL